MPKYSSDPAWSDIEPLPQDDGGPNPLAAIAYTDGYAEAMAYLRAVMAKNEMSDRALALTDDIIEMNPAHYTVWLYRARILFALDSDLEEEIQWLDEVALTHLKNYQIWHHRQLVVNKLCSACSSSADDTQRSKPSDRGNDLEIAEREREFIAQMFSRDAKNYHVWSYRQWLVRRFELWDQGELEVTERMLDEDVRNNSVWSHRFFLVNGRDSDGVEAASASDAAGVNGNGHGEEKAEDKRARIGVKDKSIRDREISLAQEAARKAPQNQSPWNYLRGTLNRAGVPLSTLKLFAEEFVNLRDEDAVRSSHALSLLAEIYAEEKEGGKDEASKAYEMLAQKYDPIRANYWNYLKDRIDQRSAATA